jgi:hypothetical protein
MGKQQQECRRWQADQGADDEQALRGAGGGLRWLIG